MFKIPWFSKEIVWKNGKPQIRKQRRTDRQPKQSENQEKSDKGRSAEPDTV